MQTSGLSTSAARHASMQSRSSVPNGVDVRDSVGYRPDLFGRTPLPVFNTPLPPAPPPTRLLKDRATQVACGIAVSRIWLTAPMLFWLSSRVGLLETLARTPQKGSTCGASEDLSRYPLWPVRSLVLSERFRHMTNLNLYQVPVQSTNCGKCNHENGAGATRCSACGHDLRSPFGARRHGERRQLTTLFCDLVDSVSLSVRLDPEDMMHVIDTYLAICDDIIAAYGGTVMQYMGDGVLAYFGYPRANEDDAANAIRAGMALRTAVGQIDLLQGIALQARIGIATGLVVVSDLIGRREARGGGIVGETPNLAARLQSIARPGAVVIGDATRRIVGDQFIYHDLGTFPLKGFPAPVQAYELVEALPIADRFLARSPSKAIPLVGREREFAMMQALWEQARKGQGAGVLLRGEPGIGKSRLVQELRQYITNASNVQLTWYCGPNTNDSALHPVTEQLSRAAGFEHGESSERRRARFDRQFGGTDRLGRAVVADLLGIPTETDSPALTLTPLRRKEITLDTLLSTVEQSLGNQPGLIVAEDLHWCDSATLELLDRVVERATTRRWLVLCTARPEFERSSLQRTNIATIDLDRLDRSNAERICRHLGADTLLPSEAVRRIIAHCDGVPLFVEEMTKSVLEAAADAPAQDGRHAVTIPASLRDSLVARLDRLGDAREMACLGAAIGRRFRYDILSAVAARSEVSLRRDLRELTRAGLVERSGIPPASVYTFKHALIRDAAYDSLLIRERELLHGRIAAVLRDRFPGAREAEPELLAYHYTESGAIAEAIPLWTEAGRRAASRAAHVEAAVHQQAALELLRRQPADNKRDTAELDLLIGLVVSLAASRGYSNPELSKVLAEARSICDVVGNLAGRFAVMRGICNFAIVGGDLPAAEELANRCMAIATETGLVEHQIEADNAMGYILHRKGDLAAAKVFLERGQRLYTEHHGIRLTFPLPHDPLCCILAALEHVLYAMGDEAGAEHVNAKVVAHARALGRTYDLAWTLVLTMPFHILRRNFAHVLELADEAIGICELHGYDLLDVLAGVYRAIATAHLGKLDGALLVVQTKLAEQVRFGCEHGHCNSLGESAWLLALSGDQTGALSTIDAAIAKAAEFWRAFLSVPTLPPQSGNPRAARRL